MHIGGKKRTEAIDDARPVVVMQGANGPVWIEAGSKKMTGDNKAELSANLRARQRHAEVVRQMKKVQEGAAGFFEAVVLGAAPQAVLDAYKEGDVGMFGRWMQGSGFTYKQDGLRSIALHNGTEVASFTARVDARLEADVLAMLRLDEGISRIEQAGAT